MGKTKREGPGDREAKEIKAEQRDRGHAWDAVERREQVWGAAGVLICIFEGEGHAQQLHPFRDWGPSGGKKEEARYGGSTFLTLWGSLIHTPLPGGGCN